MKVRSSLYLKLLLWLLLNLALIVALFIALPGRAGLGWNVLLSQPVRERLLTIGERIGRELSMTPEAGWEQILESYGAEYGVHFSIDQPGGPQGPRLLSFGFHGDRPPPDAPSNRGFSTMPPPDGGQPDAPSGPGGPPSQSRERPPEPPDGPAFSDRRMRANLISISHPHSFSAYDVRIPAMLERSGGSFAMMRPLDIHASAASLGVLLRFLGVTDWLLFALLVIGLSLLLWWPFIWGITRTLVQITRATQDIAAGRFEARVQTLRRDELGRLAQSVNRMAERLQNFVSGQKQFLADIAHEVTSPLARMQLGLGILEARAGEAAQNTLRDVQDEAQQMSRLLNELLLFSRAGMEAERAPQQPVELQALIGQVLRREDPAQEVQVALEAGLQVQAYPVLLERAVANLVRNALRYAGHAAAPVQVIAATVDGLVQIKVQDRGPGVPPEALPRLGEPFFRPEAARNRDTGGSGLGLAIVRRCVEACSGRVVFRNRVGGGFEAEISLKPQAESAPRRSAL